MDGHETFGQLVVSMRKQRRFLDNNPPKPWARAYLAEQSGLTLKQVTRVEQGSVVNMRPLLDPLAAAFGLSPAERGEFYGQAGYIHRGAPAPPDRGLLTSLLGELTYPVYVRTPLWDFVAYNAYHARLWGYDDPAKLDILRGGTVGPNLLRTIFDPVFEHRTAKGSEHAWHRDAERCLEGFRAMSF